MEPMILSCLQKPKRRLSTIMDRWDRRRGNNSRLFQFLRHTNATLFFSLPGLRASVHCPSAWPRLTCLCPTCLTRKGLPLDLFCPSGMFAPALEPASSILWWDRYVPSDWNEEKKSPLHNEFYWYYWYLQFIMSLISSLLIPNNSWESKKQVLKIECCS